MTSKKDFMEFTIVNYGKDDLEQFLTVKMKPWGKDVSFSMGKSNKYVNSMCAQSISEPQARQLANHILEICDFLSPHDKPVEYIKLEAGEIKDE